MLTKKEMTEMIGEQEYYLKAYERLKKEKKNKFNFAAALNGSFWLIYRRMYFSSILLSILNVLLGGVSTLLGFLILGFFGNKIYFKFLEDMQSRGYKNLEAKSRGVCVALILMLILLSFFVFFLLHPASHDYIRLSDNRISFTGNWFLMGSTMIIGCFLIELIFLWFFAGEKSQRYFFIHFIRNAKFLRFFYI